MAAPVLQFKRGLIANLPALKAGEPGFTTDGFDLFIGLDNNSGNNKFFGSHRYWTKETSSTGSSVKVVEGTTNGTHSIALKSPDNLAGDLTYTLPGTQGSVSSVLTNDGSGNLSWASGSANPVFTGIATFNTDQVDVNSTVTISGITTFESTADSTSKDTGALIVEGGVGIEKSVHIGAALSITTNLYVGGQSEFIGIVTFRGGTINLGDSGNDDVVIGGEFASDLIPTTDVFYNLGSSSKKWKDIHAKSLTLSGDINVTGFSTFNGLVVGNNGVSVSGFSTIYNLHVLQDLNVNGSLDVDTSFTSSGNAVFSGITSFTDGTNSTNYDNGAVVIDGGVGIQKDVHIGGDLDVLGNVSVGGTFLLVRGQDVFIENKDLILGYTTTTSPNDDTANHGGVAIASSEGSPLISFAASGINTLPDTYKQLMWFKNGTLGFATDAFAFNYALAIGTTTMANGVRLAVGTGVTASDNSVSATNFYGNGQLTNLNVSGLSTFVGVSTFQSNVFIDGSLSVGGIDISGGATIGEDISTRNINVTGLSTFVGFATFNNSVSVASSITAQLFDSSNTALQAPTIGNYAGERIRLFDFNNLSKTNYAIGAEGSNIWFGVDDNIDGVGFKWYGNTTQVARLGGTGNFTISGDFQVNGNDIKASDGTTALTLSATTGNVKTGGDLITGSGYLASANGTRGLFIYDTSGNVSFQGKAVVNDIRSSSNSNNTITLADIDATFARNVSIAGIATVTGEFITGGDITVGGNDIKASDGTTAITLSATTGNVGLSSDLTINGNLFVKGSTTEVNTETLKVEDSLIEVGLINSGGSLVPPTSDLNIDVGVIFHYFTSSAKKAGVYWDDSVSRVVVSSDLSESSSVITSATYAGFEIGSLWVNDCAGQSQVISCTGAERFLENITVDGGLF